MIQQSGLAAIVCCMLFLCSCGKSINYDLPDNPIVFQQNEEIINPHNSEDSYAGFTYNDRIYILYGTLNSSISDNDINHCLGYIANEEDTTDNTIRVYTLVKDADCNYLMVRNAVGFMEQPVFYRATDTQREHIATPEFIDSLDYAYWE